MTGRTSRIRVLHLRDSPWIDGPGRTILETATRIDRDRIDYQVGVLVPSQACPHPLLEAMRSRGLPVHEIVDDGTSLAAVAHSVGLLVDRIGAHVLHSSDFRTNLIALSCRRSRKLKVVSTAHGWIANSLARRAKVVVDRLLLRRFDRVIFVSHATRRQLPRWWVPDERASVLHNAVVAERFPFAPRAASEPVTPRGQVLLLNVGRLSTEKGQDLLLRAVAALASSYPAIRVAFAGIGPLEPQLRALAERLGISNRVKFIGYVDDIHNLYLSASLVVQVSFTEGLPNVLLEAAWLGVPILATDVGGTSEVIEHGVSGWLVRPRRLSDLTDGIRHFLEYPADFESMTRAARARIERDFSFGARTAAQVRVYEGLVAGRPA
ncbi:MAG: glycosyltransferase [Steroidobacteraceae bacterium]